MTNATSNSWRARLGTMFAVPSVAGDDTERPLPSPEPETVLVVDDDIAWTEQCALGLRALGYEPIVARSAEEAVALFLARPVEIALIDFDIPGGDGISLSYELTCRAEAAGARLHVIIATGHATKDVAIDAMRASAADILEKPIHQADLRRALQRIRGLDDAPAAREALLRGMSDLRSQLQRLSRLIDDPAGESDQQFKPTLSERLSVSDSRANELSTPTLASYIRDSLKKEARRRAIGGCDVFGDPAWEMLLDLMLAKIEQRRVSVSSACIASGAPMTTALRLVGRLVDEGVLCKQPDITDRRRHFLAINPRFEVPMLEYLTDQLQNPSP